MVSSMQDETTPVVWWATQAGRTGLYYMADSARGEDEANPAFWLATRPGNWADLARLGFSTLVPQEKLLFLAI